MRAHRRSKAVLARNYLLNHSFKDNEQSERINLVSPENLADFLENPDGAGFLPIVGTVLTDSSGEGALQ